MKFRIGFRMVTPRGWTGGVNYLFNVCRVLRAYVPEFEPVFFAPTDIDERTVEMIVESTGSLPLPLRERTHRDDMLAMAGIQEREAVQAFTEARIDVLFEATGYYGRRPPVPVLAWIQDFQHRALPQFFSTRGWLTREARYRMILSTRKHVMLSSEDAKADMLRYYGDGKAQIHVVPFAIRMDNPPTFEDGERARQTYGLPERFIFLPNQFWEHKNHKIVVEALGLLGEDAPVIAATGGADHRSSRPLLELQERIGRLGVASKFRKLGHLPYADVLRLNVRCDALLNPSLFEGWSTPVEEAKTLDTPMILSDLPVHREQVAENAIFFDRRSAEDCARALREAMARPAHRPKSIDAVRARNLLAQQQFAERLRTAFLAAMC